MLWKFDANEWRNPLLHFNQDLRKFFEEPYLATSTYFPPVNVTVTEEKAVITAEVPGTDPKDIDISVNGDTLTLRGERHEQELKEGEKFCYRERTHGMFSRTVTLPFRVDVNGVDASFKNGILTVAVPRMEADKPKKITVRAS